MECLSFYHASLFFRVDNDQAVPSGVELVLEELLEVEELLVLELLVPASIPACATKEPPEFDLKNSGNIGSRAPTTLTQLKEAPRGWRLLVTMDSARSSFAVGRFFVHLASSGLPGRVGTDSSSPPHAHRF